MKSNTQMKQTQNLEQNISSNDHDTKQNNDLFSQNNNEMDDDITEPDSHKNDQSGSISRNKITDKYGDWQRVRPGRKLPFFQYTPTKTPMDFKDGKFIRLGAQSHPDGFENCDIYELVQDNEGNGPTTAFISTFYYDAIRRSNVFSMFPPECSITIVQHNRRHDHHDRRETIDTPSREDDVAIPWFIEETWCLNHPGSHDSLFTVTEKGSRITKCSNCKCKFIEGTSIWICKECDSNDLTINEYTDEGPPSFHKNFCICSDCYNSGTCIKHPKWHQYVKKKMLTATTCDCPLICKRKVVLVKAVKSPDEYSIQHSKLWILEFRNFVRIVVSSFNFSFAENENCMDSAFVLDLVKNEVPIIKNIHETPQFLQDLLQFVSILDPTSSWGRYYCKELFFKLHTNNISPNIYLIASVPRIIKEVPFSIGLERLLEVLKNYNYLLESDPRMDIHVWSMGGATEKWHKNFLNAIEASPKYTTVWKSNGGAFFEKNGFHYKMNVLDSTGVMAHCKSMMRIDCKECDICSGHHGWVYVGSHNLSSASWGSKNFYMGPTIWELGVVCLSPHCKSPTTKNITPLDLKQVPYFRTSILGNINSIDDTTICDDTIQAAIDSNALTLGIIFAIDYKYYKLMPAIIASDTQIKVRRKIYHILKNNRYPLKLKEDDLVLFTSVSDPENRGEHEIGIGIEAFCSRIVENGTSILPVENETTILSVENETTILSVENETTILPVESSESTLNPTPIKKYIPPHLRKKYGDGKLISKTDNKLGV